MCASPTRSIAEYGGGFIGLLRPGFYKRMLDALPEGDVADSITR